MFINISHKQKKWIWWSSFSFSLNWVSFLLGNKKICFREIFWHFRINFHNHTLFHFRSSIFVHSLFTSFLENVFGSVFFALLIWQSILTWGEKYRLFPQKDWSVGYYPACNCIFFLIVICLNFCMVVRNTTYNFSNIL